MDSLAPSLRPYQAEAIEAARAAFARGDRATLIELPTGTGKTVVFASVARMAVERGGRVLVLAHRTELLTQACAKLEAAGVVSAIEQGPHRAGDAPVVVASVQTLRGSRLATWAADAFALVVIDEAHHATAAGYRAVIDHFGRARVLGVTATPDRSDGAGLAAVFGSCCYRLELRAAIDAGWLAPLVVRRVVLEAIDLGGLRTVAGDLEQRGLARAMGDDTALHGVAAPLAELAGDRRTMVFAVDVAHAYRLAEVVNRYRPGWARAIDGGAKGAERARVLDDFRAGAFGCLVNCGLYTEGFDEPTVACVAIARPTKSRALYAQMVGRGTRLAPNKADCLVLDFTGTTGRHRLVGPVDVLAGWLVPPEVEHAAAALLASGEQLDLAALLDEADTEAARVVRHASVTALASYRAERVDPFLGESTPVECEGPPATDAQRQALERAGLRDLPVDLRHAQAAAWLVRIEARRAAGLCTFKQARKAPTASTPWR
ncbi:MAG: DEAD/DEAH box helicase [Kofleriaceae bacterium]